MSVSFDLAKSYIGTSVEVTIDRPLGSRHPKHSFVYEANYGFVKDVKAPDGEDLDVYVLGVAEPLATFTGTCVAVVHREDDDDDKLIVVPSNHLLSDEEIMRAVAFQEKWFKSRVYRS